MIGGPVAELFSAVVMPPLQRRRERWDHQVSDRLHALERQGVQLSRLLSDDRFLDTALHATQIALRTSDSEKHAALLSAIEHVAISETVENARIALFLEMVDSLTTWHLRLLAITHDPKKYIRQQRWDELERERESSHVAVLDAAFPELIGQGELREVLWKELYARGLVSTDTTLDKGPATNWLQRRTTDLGRQFLDFIGRPASP